MIFFVVMAHVEFWFLGLKLSAKDVKDSRAYPSSFGVGDKGEIVWLDMTKVCSANGRDSRHRERGPVVKRGRRERRGIVSGDTKKVSMILYHFVCSSWFH